MVHFKIMAGLMLAALATLIITGSAQANTYLGDFNDMDTNADGGIDFPEFAAVLCAQGQTQTQAAQVFIRLSDGDALISKREYLYNIRVSETPSAQHGYHVSALKTPQDTNIDRAVPIKGQIIGQGQIIEITPNEEVAGEVVHAFEAERQDDDII